MTSKQIEALRTAAEAVLADWDSRGEQEELKEIDGMKYWSPRSAQVHSENIAALRAALANTQGGVKDGDDTLITDGFPDGWYVQDRPKENTALLIGPSMFFTGTQCVCLRPKLISTEEWLKTAKAIASAITLQGEPVNYWAVHSKTGMHIGLWPDKADADEALREYEGGTITPLYTLAHQPVTAGWEITVEMIDRTMVEMANIHPPLRRSDCKRLLQAALKTEGRNDG